MSTHFSFTSRMNHPNDVVEALGIPFSEEQLTAITAPLEPSVIIAGAGTGKTTVMAARVVWLVGSGQVTPDQVLGLTFTRKAASELALRVASALERAGVVATSDNEGLDLVMTYDSFAARLVRDFGLRLGIDAAPTILADASRFGLAAEVLRRTDQPLTALASASPSTITERLLAFDAEIQSHLADLTAIRTENERAARAFEQAPLWRGKVLKDVAAALATCQERAELLALVEQYQHVKGDLGVVEFADQLRQAVQLSRDVPDVAEQLRAQLRVVLLDEFQDTSAAQVSLLRNLFSGPDQQHGQGFPVTAVGDPYQAIYGWRGAAAGTITQFPRLFRRADGSQAAEYSLSINRRSGRRILEAGNEVAEGLATHPGSGVQLRAPDDSPEALVTATAFTTLPEEIDALVESLLESHAHAIAWRDHAILVRRNSLLSLIYDALTSRDIPVEIVGLGGLLDLPEIAPIVSMLQVLDDVTANPQVAALLTSPRWNIGLGDLELLSRRAQELNQSLTPTEHTVANATLSITESPCLLDAITNIGDTPLSEQAKQRLAHFVSVFGSLQRQVGGPLGELVGEVVEALGIETELLSAGKSTEQLNRFVAAASSFRDLRGGGTLSGFLAYLADEKKYGEGLSQATPTSADSVKLLSVHRSKGLEWDTVYLPSLTDAVFPASYKGGAWPTTAAAVPSMLRGDADSIPQLKEFTKDGILRYKDELRHEHRLAEDRLAYVAVTRAKRRLFASTHIWSPGAAQPRKESPYFSVLAKHAAQSERFFDYRNVELDSNPIAEESAQATWPVALSAEAIEACQAAAALVHEALTTVAGTSAQQQEWVWRSGTASQAEIKQIDAWQEATTHLQFLATKDEQQAVEIPEGLTATALIALRSNPQTFAERLVRPMPRRPSAAARLGTQFHEWVQQYFAATSQFEELSISQRAHSAALQKLIVAFEQGRFAHQVPLGIEVPFLTQWGTHVLRGRIDAVFPWAEDPSHELIVDWKTSVQSPDPLQLAVYRYAWAQARGIPLEKVHAAFYHVPTDDLEYVAAPPELIEAAIEAGIKL